MLSAPDQYTPIQATDDAISRLLAVARQDFDYVVVDAGSSAGSTFKTLLEGAAMVYLVTQVGISELRNSNRLIREFFPAPSPNFSIVLNRFTPNALGYRRREHHQGADPTRDLEDSQRLSHRAARTEYCDSAGTGRFVRRRRHSPDGKNRLRSASCSGEEETFRFIRITFRIAKTGSLSSTKRWMA